MPKPQTSGNQARGQFGRDAFRYIAEDDEYECDESARAGIQHEANDEYYGYKTPDGGYRGIESLFLVIKYLKYRHSQNLLSSKIIPLPDQPNRNKTRSNPVTGHLMQPDQITENEYRVITQPRPTAPCHQVENVGSLTAALWRVPVCHSMRMPKTTVGQQ